MPVSVSYPGLYIEEVPLDTHTVQAAPTAITAFLGYVNPWYTSSANGAGFNTAVRLSSFSDFEAAFGGQFASILVDPSLPRAVFQFFVNGGSDAYVVGLEPILRQTGATPPSIDFTASGSQAAYTATLAADDATHGLLFTAQQFCDGLPMQLTVSNLRKGPTSTDTDTFDVTLAYGSVVETYRGVAIGAAATAIPATQADTVINPRSKLVQVAPLGGGIGTLLPSAAAGTTTFTTTLPAGYATYNPNDYITVLQANSVLDQVEIFNLLLVPGVNDNSVQSAALAFAEHKMAFAILDPPAGATAADGAGSVSSFASTMPRSQNGAIYFPWLQTTDLVTGQSTAIAPSGSVAGVYASTDVARGVWKAPAGMATAILNVQGPVATGVVTDAISGELNSAGVNCIRQFASVGTVVFGARTLVGTTGTSFPQSTYVPVRRMTLFLEQTLMSNLRWVVFEPNDEPLWSAIRLSIESFMVGLWNQGALQGATAAAAFQVKCDSSTTTSADQQNGIVNIVVAFAPLKPAEFVVIKIAQVAGQAAS